MVNLENNLCRLLNIQVLWQLPKSLVKKLLENVQTYILEYYLISSPLNQPHLALKRLPPMELGQA